MTEAASFSSRHRDLLWLLGFVVVTVLLWRTPILFPLRCFVVLVHETGHAVAALVTGADVVHLIVRPDESGEVRYIGGMPIVIASAGYVGSALLGSVMLALTPHAKWHRSFAGGLGVLLIGITLLYVPFANLFGYLLGVAWGVGLLHVAIRGYVWLPRLVNSLAVMLCLYAVYDFSDFLLGDPERTDAGILARYLGLSWLAWPIGLTWVAFSIWLMYRGARVAFRL